MKKLKKLLPALIATIMAFVLVFSVACSGSCNPGDGGGGEVTTVLSSIELDTSNAKTEYLTGESFSYAGLGITAVYTKSDGSDPERRTVDVNGLGVEIDDTEFNSQRRGTYAITVNYQDRSTRETASASYEVTVSEKILEVDYSKAQLLFLVGQDDFTSEGIEVSLVIVSPTGDERTARTDYTVNSSAFRKDVVGEYTIYVSVVDEGTTVTGSYSVSVIEPRQGIAVSYAEGTENIAVLDGNLTTSLDLSKVEVRLADAYGNISGEAIPADEYEINVYNGQEPADASSLSAGAYNVWVTYTTEDGVVLEGFALFFVVDNVKSIAYNNDGVTTQPAGTDVITETWSFTVTYGSGNTKTVKKGDEGLTIIAATVKAGENLVAEVTYVEANALDEVITINTTVTYSVTEATSSSGETIELSALDWNTGDTAGEAGLEWAGHTGFGITNKVTVDTESTPKSIKLADDTSKEIANRIKLGGALSDSNLDRAVKMTLTGACEITVWALGGGSSNTGRHLKLITADHTLIATTDEVAGTSSLIESVKITITAEDYEKAADGVFYLGGDAGINIYYIMIQYK